MLVLNFKYYLIDFLTFNFVCNKLLHFNNHNKSPTYSNTFLKPMNQLNLKLNSILWHHKLSIFLFNTFFNLQKYQIIQ